MIITDKEKIKDILERGTEDIFVKEHLEQELFSGRELRIKHGIDPTGPKIHLGRAATLRKLKAFQDLGHKIVIIIGDFTAQIGDASDKLAKRPMLTREDVRENFKDYENQIGKIIDLSKVEYAYNSDWLDKLGFQEISTLADCFSVQQMIARRNFSERYEKGDEISLREFTYPLMQGYDSVAIKADVEIGGTDQLFNLKAGRIIQKHYGEKEQDIMTCTMLEGTDGRKMSTSWGNVITIVDEPADMYGKLMSVKDELIIKYLTLCTELPMTEIKNLEKEMQEGKNPKEIKMRLAYEVVKLYHGEAGAKLGEEDFVTKFQKKEIPEDLREIEVTKGELLVDVLVVNKIAKSKTDAKRLINEGAVMNLETEEKIKDEKFVVSENLKLKVGKKDFIQIKV